VLLRIYDHGIGLTPGRLAEINERLARRASLSSAAAGTMGLYVVAHLAVRHGIEVQLHPTGAGTAAYVHLPHSVLADPGEAVTAGVPAHLQGIRAGGAEGTTWFRQTVSNTSGDGASSPGESVRGPARPAAAPALASASATPSANGWGARQSHDAPPPAPPARPTIPRPRDQKSPQAGEPLLPRRQPGTQLTPSVPVPTADADADASLIDPDRVRLRLSALSEGVSAGQRRMARAGSVAVPPMQAKER
jgi:hypothetical protein